MVDLVNKILESTRHGFDLDDIPVEDDDTLANKQTNALRREAIKKNYMFFPGNNSNRLILYMHCIFMGTLSTSGEMKKDTDGRIILPNKPITIDCNSIDVSKILDFDNFAYYIWEWADEYGYKYYNGDIKLFYTMYNWDMSDWDMSNTVTCKEMFYQLENFNCNLSDWDVSKVTDMSNMFCGCKNFDFRSIAKWNINDKCLTTNMLGDLNPKLSVTNNSRPHYGKPKQLIELNRQCLSESVKQGFTLDDVDDTVSDPDSDDTKTNELISKEIESSYKYHPETLKALVHDMVECYYSQVDNARQLERQPTYAVPEYNNIVIDFNSIDVSKITDMKALSHYFATYDIANDMFCKSIYTMEGDDPYYKDSCVLDWKKNLQENRYKLQWDVSGWNVRNVTDMSYAFTNLINFNGDLSLWNVSNVTDMCGMFKGCIFFNQELNSWGDKMKNVKNMSHMFDNCQAFNKPLDKWVFEQLMNTPGMFSNCISFNQNLNSWGPYLGKVTKMNRMFYFCKVFNSPLDKWDVHNVIYFDDMFTGAVEFKQSLMSWNVRPIAHIEDMFRYTHRQYMKNLK